MQLQLAFLLVLSEIILYVWLSITKCCNFVAASDNSELFVMYVAVNFVTFTSFVFKRLSCVKDYVILVNLIVGPILICNIRDKYLICRRVYHENILYGVNILGLNILLRL